MVGILKINFQKTSQLGVCFSTSLIRTLSLSPYTFCDCKNSANPVSFLRLPISFQRARRVVFAIHVPASYSSAVFNTVPFTFLLIKSNLFIHHTSQTDSVVFTIKKLFVKIKFRKIYNNLDHYHGFAVTS